MYTIIFKYNDGTMAGHVCPSRKVWFRVIDDVMHHAGEHVEAWRSQDPDGTWGQGSYKAHEKILTAPEHMRVEWA